MVHSKLLLAVAALALVAGSGALAQQEHRGSPERAGPATQGQQQDRSSGARQQEHKEPGRVGQPGRSETTGQAPQAGQAPQTGQAPQGAAQDRPHAGSKPADDKAGQSAPERSGRGDREHPAAGQNERSNREDHSRTTTGQGTSAQPSERRDDNVQINRDRENVERDRTTIDRERGERNEDRTTTGVGRSGASVNFSEEQRTRIRGVIVKERSAPRVNSVDFSLSIGTPIPRSVRLVAVPAPLIEIEPRWRGFDYFLVGDEIVIVDPRNMEIVAVVPA